MLRRNERGIAVPCESSPFPWAIKTGDSSEEDIRDHDKEYDAGAIVDSDGFHVASVWSEDDLPFIRHAANYHERLAEIVRAAAVCHKNGTFFALPGIAQDAAELWKEMKEDK